MYDKYFKDDAYNVNNPSNNSTPAPGSPMLKIGNRLKFSGGGIQNRIKSLNGLITPKINKKN
jgi:hypothetical protein